MIAYDRDIQSGHIWVFNSDDECVGHLFNNLTSCKETETTKNAADDKLVIENYIAPGNEFEIEFFRNEYTFFVPIRVSDDERTVEGAIYKAKNVYINDDGGDNMVVGAECVSGLIELIDEPVIYLPNENVGRRTALQDLLDHEIPSRFNVGFIDPELAQLGTNIDMSKISDSTKTNKLDYLVAMVKIFGGELSCRAELNSQTGKLTRYINWYLKRGRDLGKLLLLQKDMDEVNVSISTDNIITRVYGFGKVTKGKGLTFDSILGRNYVDAPAEATRYQFCDKYPNGDTKPRAFVLNDTGIEDPVILLDRATQILAKCGDPLISVSAKINALDKYLGGFLDGQVELKFGEFTPEPWFIGDVVYIYTDAMQQFLQTNGGVGDAQVGGGIQARIIEYERDHLQPESTNVTIESSCAGIVDDIDYVERELEKDNYLIVYDTAGREIRVKTPREGKRPSA